MPYADDCDFTVLPRQFHEKEYVPRKIKLRKGNQVNALSPCLLNLFDSQIDSSVDVK